MNDTTPQETSDGKPSGNYDTDILITGISQTRISKREKVQQERKKRKLRSELEREYRERKHSKFQRTISYLQRLLTLRG